MKNNFRLVLGALATVVLAYNSTAADPKPLKDQKEKVSYGIGMNIGANLKRSGYDVDPSILAEGLKDALAGAETRLTETEAREALNAYQKEMAAKREEERVKTAEK